MLLWSISVRYVWEMKKRPDSESDICQTKRIYHPDESYWCQRENLRSFQDDKPFHHWGSAFTIPMVYGIKLSVQKITFCFVIPHDYNHIVLSFLFRLSLRRHCVLHSVPFYSPARNDANKIFSDGITHKFLLIFFIHFFIGKQITSVYFFFVYRFVSISLDYNVRSVSHITCDFNNCNSIYVYSDFILESTFFSNKNMYFIVKLSNVLYFL